jgi:hypothetical protein
MEELGFSERQLLLFKRQGIRVDTKAIKELKEMIFENIKGRKLNIQETEILLCQLDSEFKKIKTRSPADIVADIL